MPWSTFPGTCPCTCPPSCSLPTIWWRSSCRPSALAGVALWFQLTDLGIATRATGDRRDRAAMLGIPVNRLQTATWVVAGVLSFLSVFMKAAILGLPLDPTFSLTALVTALGALALGGFTNLPLVALAAVAIGTLEQGVAWNQPARPTLVLAVIAAVVVLGMFFQQVVRRPVARDSSSQWALASGVRDLPAVLRRLPEVRAASVGTTGVLVAVVVTLPLWMGPGSLLELSNLLVLAIVGCSLVILTGWSGQVSLGQMSFAAVGAVAGAVAMIDWNWDLSLALLLAGAAGGVAALLVGIPTLRLDGIFVAVTTLAFGLAVSGYLLDRAEFSWIPSGQLPTPRLFGVAIVSQTAVFATCLGVAALVVVAMHGLRHSRFGRVLRAVSTNERAVAGYGVAVNRAKLSAFGVSGFIAGLAGCLLVVANQQYVESPFTVTASLAVFTATAVGGLGSALGAVVGAALVEGSVIFLPPSWQLFPSAFGVLIVLLAFPGGVSSLLFRGRDRFVAVIARRHGIDMDPGAERGGPVDGRGGAMRTWRLASLGGGAPLFPLAILFSLQLLDQATQSAFNVLIPNVRDAFHLSNAEILLIVALAGAAALVGTIPVAWLADRTVRVRIALVGAGVGAAFSVALGLAPTAVVLAITLCGVYLGQAVIFPTHNSLIADYYPVEARPRVYSSHRAGLSLGAVSGVLIGAGLTAAFSWRVPFIVFAIPIAAVVLLGLRLREPPRGRYEQAAMDGPPGGALAEAVVEAEAATPGPLPTAVAPSHPLEPPPSFGEAWRMVWKIGVLRRIFFALPFLAAAIAGFTSLASLQYQETFHLDVVQRAFLVAPVQVFVLIGLVIGAGVATRLGRPRHASRVPDAGGGLRGRLRRSRPCSPWRRTSRWPSSPTPASRRRWPSSGPAYWPRCRWPSPRGPGRSGSRSVPSSCCPGWWSSRWWGPSAMPWASATACSSWCRSSSSGG